MGFAWTTTWKLFLENCILKFKPRNIKTSKKRIERCTPKQTSLKPTTVYNAIYTGRSSKKERRVDALAPGAEEGRDKLRKATGRSKYPAIRRYPNGETRLEELQTS